jgi:hypothetical protein
MLAASVDPDEPSTWTDEMRTAVERYRHEWAEVIPPRALLGMLDGRPLRAYHATRLLPHEIDNVRERGLVPLTPRHVLDRLDAAVALRALSAAERDQLRASQVFSADSRVHFSVSGRRDRVCAVVGKAAVNCRGLKSLLGLWGGEAIYMGTSELHPRLSQIGTPTIVVLDLLLTPDRVAFIGDVFSVMVARRSDQDPPEAEVHVRGAVSPDEVADIWQPGSEDYDLLPGLPRR